MEEKRNKFLSLSNLYPSNLLFIKVFVYLFRKSIFLLFLQLICKLILPPPFFLAQSYITIRNKRSTVLSPISTSRETREISCKHLLRIQGNLF